MLSKNKTYRRLRRFGFLAVLICLACLTLQAQSGPTHQPANQLPSSTPAAPAGTKFSSKGGNNLEGPDTRVTAGIAPTYRIGADDVLTVNVWHEPEVSRNVPVRPDGKISLPLIGDVQAAGLTPAGLKTELEQRFAKFLTAPDVSVIVAEIRSQRINVLGQVYRPGTYALIPPMSVLDAIAVAGGLKEFAKSGDIYVLRTEPNGHREHLKFKYKDVLKGKKGSKDILLQTRDTVVVP